MTEVKCDVCDSEDNVRVVSSRFGPISNAYCNECLTVGKEDYGTIVAYISCIGDSLNDVNELYKTEVLRQLKLHNKTVDEFEDDLRQMNKKMNEYYEYEYPEYYGQCNGCEYWEGDSSVGIQEGCTCEAYIEDNEITYEGLCCIDGEKECGYRFEKQ